MRSTTLGLLLLPSVMLCRAAECDSTAIRIAAAESRLTISNNSDKPVVAYVLASSELKSTDGSPVRTFSGVFSGKDSIAPGKSMDLGKADVRPTAIFVDYIRFADGSACGNITTEQAKAAAARFPPENKKQPTTEVALTIESSQYGLEPFIPDVDAAGRGFPIGMPGQVGQQSTGSFSCNIDTSLVASPD